MVRFLASCLVSVAITVALRAGKQLNDHAPSGGLAAANVSATKIALSNLQEGSADKTGVPWCRPRPCWSAQHHGHELQGDRPLCADAMFNMLVALSERLEAEHYDWQICQGTLLGAIRDKDIIPWTADVDICLGTDSWQRLRGAAVPRGNGSVPLGATWRTPQWLSGYTFGYNASEVSTLFRGCEDDATQARHFLRYDDRSVVYADVSDSDREPWPQPWRMRQILAGPKRMVEIRGRLFPAASDAEAELEILYGPGWRVPNTTQSGHGNWLKDLGFEKGTHTDESATSAVRGASILGSRSILHTPNSTSAHGNSRI